MLGLSSTTFDHRPTVTTTSYIRYGRRVFRPALYQDKDFGGELGEISRDRANSGPIYSHRDFVCVLLRRYIHCISNRSLAIRPCSTRSFSQAFSGVLIVENGSGKENTGSSGTQIWMHEWTWTLHLCVDANPITMGPRICRTLLAASLKFFYKHTIRGTQPIHLLRHLFTLDPPRRNDSTRTCCQLAYPFSYRSHPCPLSQSRSPPGSSIKLRRESLHVSSSSRLLSTTGSRPRCPFNVRYQMLELLK